MHNLERRPDNGKFDNLELETGFNILAPALGQLKEAITFECKGVATRTVTKDTEYGQLILAEALDKDSLHHKATLVKDNFERGFTFKNGELDEFIGYSVYTSNEEIERFLNGFTKEIQKCQ